MVALAVLIYFLNRGLDTNQQTIPSVLVGKPALDFQASWIQGQEHLPAAAGKESFQLADFKGRPLILNFWASWCISCRQEARDLEAFWQHMKEKNVAVVGIAIQDTREAAEKFARAYGKTYILGLDESGTSSFNYGVTGVPETFFIDKEGRIIHKEAAPLSARSLNELARRIL